MIEERDLNQLKKVFKKYPILGAYVYGSKVSGKTSALSDLDIGILLKKSVSPKRYFDLQLKIQNNLGEIFRNETIDLVILNEASPLLAQNVVSKGKLVFSDNKSKLVDFACQTLKKFDDTFFLRQTFYYYLKQRALQGKLGETNYER